MPKTPISVTLESANLMWLKARARSSHARSVSDVLDRLVTAARSQHSGADVRSVVGTIDADPSDPLLLKADEAIRTMFENSIGRPFLVKETPPAYGKRARKPRG